MIFWPYYSLLFNVLLFNSCVIIMFFIQFFLVIQLLFNYSILALNLHALLFNSLLFNSCLIIIRYYSILALNLHVLLFFVSVFLIF